MGVLEQLRSGSDSAWMQLVLGAVLLSFVFWYGQPQGQQGRVIATVNGSMIRETEFNRVYRNEERLREQRYDRSLSEEEQRGLYEEVRQRMITEEVVLQEARRIGLTVGDKEVARQLLDVPIFRDDSGKFDEKLYTSWLKRSRQSRDEFEKQQAERILRDKLRAMVMIGATTSEPVVKEAFIENNTKIDLTTVRVRASAFYKEIVPTEEEKTAWIAGNGDKVKEIYDRDFDRDYNHPESIQVRAIILPIREDGVTAEALKARVEGIRAQIEGGADFAELARKFSEDSSAAQGGDLGLKATSQFSTTITSAVEGLAVGAVSPVAVDERQVSLYKVEQRIAAKIDKLEEVQGAIAEQALKEEKAPTLAGKFAEEVLLPKWKETGSAPEELLDGKGLVKSSTGLLPVEQLEGPFAPPKGLIKAARKNTVGTVLPEVYEQNGVLWVGQLTGKEEANLAEFEANKAKITEQALMERRIGFLQGWETELVAQATIQ